MISICIPSYNSLEYLKILCKGIKKNTKYPYEILIHNNQSTDGTYDWLKSLGLYKDTLIGFETSNLNLGFAGVNSVLKCAKYPYTMIFNSDMYPLPGWDLAIVKQVEKFQTEGIEKFTISSCLIEPQGSNPEYNIFYAGHDAQTFNESLLLGTYIKEKEKSLKKENTIQYSHPILFPTEMLKEMNYLDENYFPGWSLDHDMAASAYRIGCRDFIMLGSSRVYHFISKTFTKLPNNVRSMHGQNIFQSKWHMSVDEFRNRFGVKKSYAKIPNGLL